jgi:hypothetical protein
MLAVRLSTQELAWRLQKIIDKVLETAVPPHALLRAYFDRFQVYLRQLLHERAMLRGVFVCGRPFPVLPCVPAVCGF